MSRKPYAREMTSEWITRHPRYLRYMLRELSCLFIGAYGLMLVVGLLRLSQGPTAWNAFLGALASPAGVAFHVVALAFSVYHSVTWFNLTPKALPLQLGARFVPDGLISGAHYLGWALVSIALLALAGAF